MTGPRLDPEVRARIAAHDHWYHTIDLPDGVTTNGFFDLRAISDGLPWPDVRGKRCLDVGTYDGYFAFQLEQRGAAEVVAVDVPSKDMYDWPAEVRPGLVSPSAADQLFYQTVNGTGFSLAAQALGSKAKWTPLSIYDLDPANVGRFDVVVCSSLLLHLRDPIRALEAVRSICTGDFMSFEPIDLRLTAVHRRMAVARFDGSGLNCQWWTPNGAAQYRMMTSAGFAVLHVGKPTAVAFHAHSRPKTTAGTLQDRLLARLATGTWTPGVIQRPIVARPVL
jgi:tRNA (mo5U34)-methyltransferase